MQIPPRQLRKAAVANLSTSPRRIFLGHVFWDRFLSWTSSWILGSPWLCASFKFRLRLSRSGAGWTLGEMIMPALIFAAILVAVALIIYEVEVYLPHGPVDPNATAPATTHQRIPLFNNQPG